MYLHWSKSGSLAPKIAMSAPAICMGLLDLFPAEPGEILCEGVLPPNTMGILGRMMTALSCSYN